MEILERKVLAKGIVQFVVLAPRIAAKALPGHFVIARHKETGERIPLTIADFDKERGTITLVIQGVGRSTVEMNQLEKGDHFLDILGPLGTPYHPHKIGTVACVAGGLGIAPLYPKTKALFEAGNRIISIVGAQKKDMLIMVPEMEKVSNELHISTDDGSLGHKGFVTELLEQVLQKEQVQEVVAIGPVPMMRAAVEVAKKYAVPVVVSLNTLMVDGTGMCGGCRVTVGGEVKFCCVDGPVFDGAKVDFEEVISRQRYYRDMEQVAKHKCKLEEVK